ncbi:MAG: hypothetical protein M0P72_03860 [Metallibacterium scheffleri]|jgi:hypothetical protein|uniref:hypothetical protein n=1 Tax=Metallibacterium scheffleri TaxID=993689 RepID=UPI0026F20B02|nr:hypothetical protein [Metallibacterium scheffleri]MCK9366271.1 hypothetical protein [Metallibacterium scheffleri]
MRLPVAGCRLPVAGGHGPDAAAFVLAAIVSIVLSRPAFADAASIYGSPWKFILAALAAYKPLRDGSALRCGALRLHADRRDESISRFHE